VIPAVTVKIGCHPHMETMYPPRVGASMGETPSIRISVEKTRALWSTGKTSLTTALGATIPTQPPSAWMKRKKIRVSTVFEKAQPIEARI
jgi:hypothetical protein